METGFYWFYTLDVDGDRIETSPGILWYNMPNDTVTLLGYDVDLPYCPLNYELLQELKHEK